MQRGDAPLTLSDHVGAPRHWHQGGAAAAGIAAWSSASAGALPTAGTLPHRLPAPTQVEPRVARRASFRPRKEATLHAPLNQRWRPGGRGCSSGTSRPHPPARQHSGGSLARRRPCFRYHVQPRLLHSPPWASAAARPWQMFQLDNPGADDFQTASISEFKVGAGRGWACPQESRQHATSRTHCACWRTAAAAAAARLATSAAATDRAAGRVSASWAGRREGSSCKAAAAAARC